MGIEVEELPVWIVKLIEDDPDQPGCSLITLTLEEDPETWMTVRLTKEDAADVEAGMKAKHAVVNDEEKN